MKVDDLINELQKYKGKDTNGVFYEVDIDQDSNVLTIWKVNKSLANSVEL